MAPRALYAVAIGLVFLIIGAMSQLSPTPALAESGPSTVIDGRKLPSQGSRIENDSMVGALAESRGVDESVANRYLNAENLLLPWVPRLRNEVPAERLAGISIIGDGVLPVILVRLIDGSNLPGLDAVLKRMGALDVKVERGFSTVQDRVAAIDEGLEAWKVQLVNLQGVYVDESSDDIVAELNAADPSVSDVIAVPDGASLKVNVVGASSDSNYGGRDLKSCTAGFIVENVNNHERRIMTAGHCGPPQPWYGFGSTVRHGTDRTGIRYNTFADLSWYKRVGDPKFGPRAFHSSTSSTIPNVENVANVNGGTACHRGKNSGFSCGPIISIQYAPSYNGACRGGSCQARFVLADSMRGVGGDSGGPVWDSLKRPIGIWKGGNSGSGQAFRGFWTKLGNKPGSLDILLP